ncbi:hypothetical protein DYB26_011082 [Aphanomyces astaci]|uniref:Ricin B lectin domain-containing protein n=2 Tax=Aphanomyces astaci TaxID=112090 RepID=A0A3R6XS21_APHAT|nr:hypothetical protein DYB26_011082 [Aphanomyces astaci]
MVPISTAKVFYFTPNRFDDNAVVESADLDAHVWLYDPLLQRIRNKAYGGPGLDLVERKVKGLVQGCVCDHTPSQSWSYNEFTGQIQHLGTMGLCLNVDKNLYVVYCDTALLSQKSTLTSSTPKYR